MIRERIRPRTAIITLFVACFNEEDGILATLETLLAGLAEVGCTYDIVVVDDASKDRSVPIVQRVHGASIPMFPSRSW